MRNDSAISVGAHKPVLLFYDGFERKALRGLGGALYSEARFLARTQYRQWAGVQVYTGLYVAFQCLRDSLRRLGVEVRVNDFAYARAWPDHPIGLCGYPSVLRCMDLPNPKVLGPANFGTPEQAGAILTDPTVHSILQPSDWYVEFYRPFCGDKTRRWAAGIDTDRWADASDHPKDVDVVIYDKIRWDWEQLAPTFFHPLVEAVRRKGLTYRILRYGHHTNGDYAKALRSARSMIFVCEHESQGLACEEAMAMNVPVLAWDEGRLIDPEELRFAKADLQVSSVPYFDDRCGERFTKDNFAAKLDLFWSKLEGYRPRDLVIELLSQQRTALEYLAHYDAASSDVQRVV